jgi:hypothetical protein
MTNVFDFESLIYGNNGFESNQIDYNNDKYWLKQYKAIEKEVYSLGWEEAVEMDYFLSDSKSINPIDLNIYVNNTDIKRIRKSLRVGYYDFKIRHTFYLAMKEVSRQMRETQDFNIDSFIIKIRSYIVESNRLMYKYSKALSLVLEDEYKISNEVSVASSNFVINLFFRNYLLSLYNHISITYKGVELDFSKDAFLRNTIQQIRHENISYFKDAHLSKKIAESPYLISSAYRQTKEYFYLTYNNGNDPTLRYIELLSDVIFLENHYFKYDILKGLKVEIEFDDNITDEELLQLCYTQITNSTKTYILPSTRLMQLDDIIKLIDKFLDDNTSYPNDNIFNSVPRRLKKQLTLDYNTIEANPKIDLKEFEKSLIKPIKTNLSVQQIAYLFKLFEENKIIDVKPNERIEYYKTLSRLFSTSRVENISVDSMTNKYTSKDDNSSKEFWKDKFFTFAKEIKFSK